MSDSLISPNFSSRHIVQRESLFTHNRSAIARFPKEGKILDLEAVIAVYVKAKYERWRVGDTFNTFEAHFRDTGTTVDACIMVLSQQSMNFTESSDQYK